MDTPKLLTRLSQAVGLSGYERPVRSLIREEFSRCADEVRIDPLGNLIAHKMGQGEEPRRRVMLAAHMDEIGLMVTGIEKGFLRIARVGGVDERVLLAQPITVHGSVNGAHELPGVVASVPPHLVPTQEQGKTVPIEKLFVDVGLPIEQVEQRVRIGDLISFRQDAIELKGGLVSGKAMDDRAAVTSVAVCLDLLNRMHHNWDVYAVATVQEEVGLFGALTSAFGVKPDIAIAIDVTFADQPGASDDRTFPLGKGPTIGIGPNFHPLLFEAMEATAKGQEIPYHIEPTPGSSGTDAWAIQISREGVPSALLSIPARYMHSPIEIVAVKDVERTGRLMAHFIAGLGSEFLPTMQLFPEAKERSDAGES